MLPGGIEMDSIECLAAPDVARVAAGGMLADAGFAARVERHLDRCGACRRAISAVARMETSVAIESDDAEDSASSASTLALPIRHRNPGDRVDQFTIVRRLGAGAFGTVYEAVDSRIDRRVALKFVPAQQSARLFDESHALGRLDHPNVVTVHDVRRVSGGAMVVMALVEGPTLGAWAELAVLPTRRIVEVLRDVAAGLAAIHAAGLVHRDIKPQNLLIGTDGRPKIVDFGLAHPVGPEDRLELDGDGAGAGGTPAYMAPELLTGAQATAASDQYSLCVTMFEVLYGVRPFAGRSKEQLLASIRRARFAVGSRNRRIPGWLRAIMRRGLAFEPSRRFATVEELASALQRGLHRRRRGATWAGAAVVAMTAGLAGAWWTRREVDAQRCEWGQDHIAALWSDTKAEQVRASILAVAPTYGDALWKRIGPQLDSYAERWATIHREACQATILRGERSPEVMDRAVLCLQRAELALTAAVDILATADAGVAADAHAVVDGLPALEPCVDLEALLGDVDPPKPDEAGAVQEIRRLLAQAGAAGEAGKYAVARTRVEQASELLAGVDYGPVAVEVALAQGTVFALVGDYSAAEQAFQRALEQAARERMWTELRVAAVKRMVIVALPLGRFSDALELLPIAAGIAHGNRAQQLEVDQVVARMDLNQLHLSEAERAFRRILTAKIEAPDADALAVAEAHTDLGRVLTMTSLDGTAEAEVEVSTALNLRAEALSPEHPLVLSSRTRLAVLASTQRKYPEAEVAYRDILDASIKVLGPNHPSVAEVRSHLAEALIMLGRAGEAETEARKALAVALKTHGPRTSFVGLCHSRLANALDHQGRHAEAELESRRSLDVYRKVFGPQHINVAIAHNELGNVLRSQKRYEEAETEFRMAVAIGAASGFTGPYRDLARLHLDLAHCLIDQAKYIDAERYTREAEEIAAGILDPGHPGLLLIRDALTEALLGQGRLEEAQSVAESNWAQSRAPGVSDDLRAIAAFALARTLWETGRKNRDAARRLALKALELHRPDGPDQRFVPNVQAWLASHRRN